ncbi:MAG: glutathione S-transferase N-terminal domain-containing protein [Myxococcaceae bacterium]|nr:glutathione S-transferase N-terminal domain-containing protein [Myxococcaceae bacterium]
MSAPLRLVGRSSSHFTRVARMVAAELGLEVELVVLHDVMNTDVASYGGHPGMKIPSLLVGEGALFGTDTICRTLAELAGRDDDPRVVLSHHLRDHLARSAQEVVWNAMAAQVQLVLRVMVGRLPAEHPYFAKARLGLEQSLCWLDERLDGVLGRLPPQRQFSVFEVSLFCLLEHLRFRPTLEWGATPALDGFRGRLASRPSAQATVFGFDPPARV